MFWIVAITVGRVVRSRNFSNASETPVPQCGVASPGFLASPRATDWRRGTVATYSFITFHYLSSWCGILKYPPYELSSAPVIVLLRNFPAWENSAVSAQKPSQSPEHCRWGVYSQRWYMCVCVELNLQDSCVPSYNNWWQVAQYTMPVLPYVGHNRCPSCLSLNQISEIVGGKVKVSRPLDDKF